MCIIAVCNSARVNLSTIEEMEAFNPDGLGIGWIDSQSHTTRWRKGLLASEVAKLASKLPFPYIIHARLATVGRASDALCHPFEIAAQPSQQLRGAAPRVLFHNGHVNDWRTHMLAAGLRLPGRKNENWSDSRALAATLSRTRSTLLHKLVGNRFAILDAKGREPVKLFGRWTEEGGIHWSSPLWVQYLARKVDTSDDLEKCWGLLYNAKDRSKMDAHDWYTRFGTSSCS